MTAAFDAAALANRATSALRAYDPGHDLPALRQRFGGVLSELGSNENPLGPSPLAMEAATAVLNDVWRYPDPLGASLKHALSAELGISVDRITLGNGSHELLMLLAQCFADADHPVVHSQYGFAVFPIAAAAAGAPAVRVPALPADHPDAPYGHDLDAIADAVDASTRLVYLANPNNPTGTWFTDAALEDFLARVPTDTLVVVDEAYHEYVDAAGLSTGLHLLDRYPNLIVTRTFSKAYALAGLRIGYMLSHPSVAAVCERLRESFNVNAVALAAAEAALGDHEHRARVREVNQRDRAWLAEALTGRGLRVLPSQTNFLLVDLGRDAADFERHLFEHAVIVRPMGGYGLPHTVRISIGSRDELQRLLENLS
ncbi:histidinol-phosphate aminotransferase [Luteibacter rhizovicinus]|uniref:Histidinol-phosphate aminotransferase n=1 Tax=Luteibacter rhizovicinus TaxID=242606 RepID=A0A4R3Z0N4_9GAMM|nr:histidinol-phosphate transaminase [Luteibacter rhizovicinus]TCV97273.1 histidinol-phosphate aminotransferase [Luteibacter rhizovicinus]